MYGNGRIGAIKIAIETKYGKPIKEIRTTDKLDALCEVMQINASILDYVLASNAPVSRTVKGHCFESFFDRIMKQNGIDCIEVGGDDEVDRIVNGHTLQLKTPTLSGTRGNLVQYKTHKTHGAKSEKESFDYYHKIGKFADYLVGLISYNPLNIIILNKNELPLKANSPGHIQSPFTVDWVNHEGLNAYGRLGLHSDFVFPQNFDVSNQLLPETAKLIGVDTDDILNTIINDANFRVWDMAVRGFIRERVFTEMLLSEGVAIQTPSGTRAERADKADYAIKLAHGHEYIQMKGVSTNNCDFTLVDPIIGTETQLTRGRVNDHPTQSRLYLSTDFDYLALALDPPLVKLCREKYLGKGNLEWEFYLIKTSKLDVHHNMPHRLKSLQTFRYSDLQEYKVKNWSNFFKSN